MELDELRRLLQLMDDNGLAELEVEEAGRKIRLRKHEIPAAPHMVSLVPSAGPHSAPAIASASPAAPAIAENQVLFTSPLVGTFYRSVKPDADPFVEVGDQVNAEKVLCIIEAMKVMNEIKAEVDGIVKEIIAKNGQPVEYGEPLFVIEKR